MQSSWMLSERTDARFLAILIMLVLSCTLYDICACIQEIKSTHPFGWKVKLQEIHQNQSSYFFPHNWQLVSSGVTLIVHDKRRYKHVTELMQTELMSSYLLFQFFPSLHPSCRSTLHLHWKFKQGLRKAHWRNAKCVTGNEIQV